MHQSLLNYRRYHYLKVTLLIVGVAIMLYVGDEPIGLPNGGTWVGYTLGILAAFIVAWLMWFGVRKRQYQSTAGTVAGWLSAHVYLGTSLLVIATLHGGFQFGWNVHTLSYAFMVAVIVSGFYGVYAYLCYPTLLAENRSDLTLPAMLMEISELDHRCRELALPLSDEIARTVLEASNHTPIGGSLWSQWSGHYPNCGTAKALRTVQRLAREAQGAQLKASRELLTCLTKKQQKVAQARRYVQHKAKLEAWLYLHVPLSFGLLATLIAHIIAVFFYW